MHKRQQHTPLHNRRSLPEFEDGTFGCVLDKGTLDAILCGSQAFANASAAIAECFRCGCGGWARAWLAAALLAPLPGASRHHRRPSPPVC